MAATAIPVPRTAWRRLLSGWLARQRAGLYVAGMLMLTWFLVSLSMGPEAYAIFCSFAGSWFGQLILIGLTWAMFQHMASDIRHLFMDTGVGFGSVVSRRSAAATFVFSITLTVMFWIYIWIL